MKQPLQWQPGLHISRCPSNWPYRLAQQYNCNRGRVYQQQSGQRQAPKPTVPSPSTDSESKHLRLHIPHHKFYQKQKLIAKLHHKPLHRHQEKAIYFVSVKRELVVQRGLKRKQELEIIFDWMMELASVLKVTKNAYYRSIIIFYRVSELQPKILFSKRLSHYVCACISIGAKFQSSDTFVEKVCLANARRVTKEEISQAEYQILTLLNWKIPVDVSIELQLSDTVRSWNEFILCTNRQMSDRDADRFHKLLINPSEKASNKLYIEIVYILDYLTIKLHGQFLKQKSFRVPILMALYLVTSIRVVGMHLDQNSLIWQTFEYYLSSVKMIPQDQIQKFRADVQRHFIQLKIFEVLGRIPLNLNFEKLIKKKYEQFYMPKIDSSF